MAKKKVKPTDPDVEHGKTMRKIIDDFADNMGDGEMLIADGFDAAIIGVTEGMEPVVAYDWNKCVEILCKDMPIEDAIEHMSFNVTGAYVGPRTPIFIRTDLV